MTVEEFFKRYDTNIEQLALKARETLLSIVPEAVETIDLGHGTVRYGTGASMSAAQGYISGFKGHVNIGFMNGASLPDPHGLLEGTGKNLRHVKIRKLEDLNKPGLRDLIGAAFGKG